MACSARAASQRTVSEGHRHASEFFARSPRRRARLPGEQPRRRRARHAPGGDGGSDARAGDRIGQACRITGEQNHPCRRAGRRDKHAADRDRAAGDAGTRADAPSSTSSPMQTASSGFRAAGAPGRRRDPDWRVRPSGTARHSRLDRPPTERYRSHHADVQQRHRDLARFDQSRLTCQSHGRRCDRGPSAPMMTLARRSRRQPGRHRPPRGDARTVTSKRHARRCLRLARRAPGRKRRGRSCWPRKSSVMSGASAST